MKVAARDSTTPESEYGYVGGNSNDDSSSCVKYDPSNQSETEEKVDNVRSRGYQGPVEYDPKEKVSCFVYCDRNSTRNSFYAPSSGGMDLAITEKTYADFFDTSQELEKQVTEIGVGILIGDKGHMNVPHFSKGNDYGALCVLDLEVCEGYLDNSLVKRIIGYAQGGQRIVKLGKNNEGKIIKVYVPSSLVGSREEWRLSAVARAVYDFSREANGIPKVNAVHNAFEDFALIKLDAKLQYLSTAEYEETDRTISLMLANANPQPSTPFRASRPYQKPPKSVGGVLKNELKKEGCNLF